MHLVEEEVRDERLAVLESQLVKIEFSRFLFTVYAFALDKYLFFVIVCAPFQVAKNKLSLVSRFQFSIVCHQQTPIGKAIEV